jgi:mRNA interferase HigB
MHVISKKTIEIFTQQHPIFKTSLDSWFKIVSKTNFVNPIDLQNIFPSIDVVKDSKNNNLTVFDIHGNKVRLIASIHYNRNKLYIRHILTHAEYDKNNWKT